MANDPSLTPAPSPMASPLPLVRTRLALALVALVAIALELTLMRGLAIRLSSHFAGIVISVGLLGFGAAGSVLTLWRNIILRHQRTMLVLLALALSASVPVTWFAAQRVPLNVNYLAWSLSEAPHVLLIELLMVVPFAFAGMFIGIALMDLPGRINGHYASDLLGSGIGGVAAVLAMNGLTITQLLITVCLSACMAAAILLEWKRVLHVTAALLTLGFGIAMAAWMPWEPAANQYKPLTLSKLFEGTHEIYTAQGPLGRIDVIEGPSLHSAPEISPNYADDLPPHVEIYVDGDGPALLFDCIKTEQWVFADYRTPATPFHLLPPALGATGPAKVCILGAGGGVDIGLALYHHAADITALELNPQIIRAMNGPLAPRGGTIYNAPGVHIVNQEARGFFAATRDLFDVIEFSPTGGLGLAGSNATQESYLYTVESVRAMFQHLSPGGILAITRGINSPPREELRAFDLAAEALRQENIDPVTHLAMIRNFNFSCSILVFKQAITPVQTDALRAFCKKMSFDLCALPGLKESESNLHNTLASPDPYFQGTQALLAGPPQRQAYLDNALFELSAPTDDQPYFFHMFRWRTYETLQKQYGQTSHGFLEVSYVMLLVALAQAVLLAAVLILLPLSPGIKSLRQARGKTVCLGYFLMLGLGFMLLEMGFVQKLVLYLAHPIYAASVAIASFLVFAGLGSTFSKMWPTPPQKTAPIAAAISVALGLLYLVGLDRWLDLTQSWDVATRCLVAAGTIAPLAFAMGHLFPLGLQRVADTQPALVPWSWAINGFASVVATGIAPLMAMQFGFSDVVLTAVGCYVLAGLLFGLMPKSTSPSPAQVT